jgi:hypothetical protein
MHQFSRTFDGSQSPLAPLLAFGAAVVLFACSASALADNCAVGADATGNDCNGEQAVRGLSMEESHLLQLQGQAALWDLRVDRARQRLISSAAEVKAAEAELKTAEADRKAARAALSAAQKTKQPLLADKTR